jgi:histidinol-phosphate aminotransferase
MNRYPDPDATLLRRRLADRYDEEPGRIAVGNGSCDLLLAAASALCEPGDEILYAWPSFSMYPYLPALTGAREIRVPLGEGDALDLDAMATEVTAATQLLIVCNPNNPTATHHPVGEIAAFLEKVPARVTVILDEAYIEFQTNDDPDSSLDLLKDFPNLVVLRTFSKCYGLAGLRLGYAIGSSNFRAAVDAVRQPFSVNALAQAAGAEAILHQDDVLVRIESTVVERIRVQEGVRELGLWVSESQSNFSWIDLGDNDEAEVLAGLSAADIAVRAGAPLGDPGHIRVSYGKEDEDGRFLAALARWLG